MRKFLQAIVVCVLAMFAPFASADEVNVFQHGHPWEDVAADAFADAGGDAAATALNAINIAGVNTVNRGVDAFNLTLVVQDADLYGLRVDATAFSFFGDAAATATNIGNVADVSAVNINGVGFSGVLVDQVLHVDDMTAEAFGSSFFGDAAATATNIGNVVNINTGSRIALPAIPGGGKG